uniref:Uncharacterized protein n=1 Tax=mine drainage metagenome TaxID=410659 RepID=E6PYE0_9ZZZZ
MNMPEIYVVSSEAGRREQNLCPVAAVERAVLDGFSEVTDGEGFGAFEVGDGAGDLENAVVGAGAEALLLHGAFEQPLGVCAEVAVGANLAGSHLGVGVDFFLCLGKAVALALAGGDDAVANLGGTFGGGAGA